MLMSQLFGTTLRDAPVGAETTGYKLLLRGAYVRQVGAGIFAFLPLGLRVCRRLEGIIREEMIGAGAVEVEMPIVLPADLWRASGRYESVGPELARFADRRQRDLVLAMTHEEVVANLAASEIRSWRQLPLAVFHFQTKWRDDARPRAGLIRTREFVMKDAYTLDRDEAGLALKYEAMYRAYEAILRRCGLPFRVVEADVGVMGGSLAHEFMYPNEIGEDTLVLCNRCGYAKNRQVANAGWTALAEAEPPLEIERVETPGATTIEALSALLGIGPERTAKVVFMAATVPGSESEALVVAVVRGDKTLNETKVANAVGASGLRPMTEEEIVSIGCVPGYASPIGIGERTIVLVDPIVAASPNLVAGANDAGYHLRNTNAGRDYIATQTVDITATSEGDPCPDCGSPLVTERAVEIGNIFRLGTKYAEAAGARFLDENGKEQPIVMGSYGIGIGRLLGCLAEEYADEKGVSWPASVAPFDVEIVALGTGDVLEQATAFYGALTAAGYEPLLDDRDERAGVKFADADLIGAPARVTVSARSLAAGGIEVRAGRGGEASVIPHDELLEWLASCA